MKTDSTTQRQNRRNQISLLFCLIIFAAGFLLFFSSSTSPVFPNNYGVDSAFYRFIGKMILQEKILYKDIWDNKGPILFFIQAAGALNGTKNADVTGTFILQVIFLSASLFIIYQAYRIVKQSKASNLYFFFYALGALAIFGKTIESGNLSEEWCLPFICCSLFLLIKYAVHVQDRTAHPYLFSFIHGICIAIIAFIRINNAISNCTGLLIIAIYLMRRKEWKNLFLNILFGFLGICTIALPILIYFKAKGALYDMVYGVFLYNLKYFTHGESHHSFTGAELVLRTLPQFSALGIILIHLFRSKRIQLADMICLAVTAANTFMLWNSNIYLHYFTIFIPVFVLVLSLYVRTPSSPEFLLTFFTILFFIYKDSEIIQRIQIPSREPEHYSFAASIPADEKESAIGIWVSPEIYLNSGLIPVSRYCAYQFIHFSVDPSLKKTFLEDIDSARPKWIILLKDYENNYDSVIREIISEAYERVHTESEVVYYRRTDR